MPNPKRKRRSLVWNYYKSNEDNTYAECSHCLKMFRTNGGCTSGLTRHLETHGIFLKDDGENSKRPVVDTTETITKLVAQDGLPFSVVASSSSIRLMYEAATTQKMPSSPNTIREIMLKCFNEKKSIVISQFHKLKSEGKKFSLTLDEWTSAANRRYMNINVHSVGRFWNLGLIRSRGSLTAEACLSTVEEKLMEFGISLQNDIFGIATDGAAVMKRFGHLSGRQHILCLAHGIHLAVVAVLYKNEVPNVDLPVSEEDEDEEITSEDSPLVDHPDEERELVTNLNDVISKVRKTVKLFRRSPLKSEVLAKYSVEGVTLILDTKTRWNSLLSMLERVGQLKDAIQKTMIDIREQPILTEYEFLVIEDLIRILKPVKVAVDALCRSDTNLITADVALNFMMGKLRSVRSPLGIALYEELKMRILERRTFLSDVASYLHYGNDDELQGHRLGYFKKRTQPNLPTQIRSLHEMFSHSSIHDEAHATHTSDTENTEISQSLLIEVSMEAELSVAINQAASFKLGLPNSTAGNRPSRDPSATLLGDIRREMTTLERSQIRGKALQIVFDRLMTVPACTVESERAFSCANNFCRKVRTRLGDISLNALVFLKYYYKENESNSSHIE